MNTCTSDHPAVRLLTDHPDRFARQGAVVASWRTYRGRRLGPYYRLAWRETGRQRSIYLGPDGPLVDEVRRCLHQAQTARRLIREHRRNRQLFRENVVRPLEQYVKEIFRLFGNGLYVKGSDIGGVKTAGPRLTAADVPEHLIPKFPLPFPSFLANPACNPTREQGQPTTPTRQPGQPDSNPTRERGQSDSNPTRERGQPDTNPTRQRRQHTPSPCHQHHSPEFPDFVDQKRPHHPPLDPKPRQARDPTFTNMRAPYAQVQKTLKKSSSSGVSAGSILAAEERCLVSCCRRV